MDRLETFGHEGNSGSSSGAASDSGMPAVSVLDGLDLTLEAQGNP